MTDKANTQEQKKHETHVTRGTIPEKPEERETTRLDKIRLLDALELNLGIVTDACEAVNISRTTHYAWLKDDPEYAEKVRAIDEKLCDFIESKFVKKLKDEDTNCILHGLKTKCRKRGYGEIKKVELEGGVDAKIDIPPETVEGALDQIYKRREEELKKQKAEEEKPDAEPGA